MLLDTIQTNLKDALKSHDDIKVSTLRLLISALHNERIAKMHDLHEDEEIVVFAKQAKQRRDSIEQYQKGGRTDLVEQETAELKIIESYLPQQMSEAEIKSVAEKKIKELGVTNAQGVGKLMGALMAELKGKADGVKVKQVVSSLLNRD